MIGFIIFILIVVTIISAVIYQCRKWNKEIDAERAEDLRLQKQYEVDTKARYDLALKGKNYKVYIRTQGYATYSDLIVPYYSDGYTECRFVCSLFYRKPVFISARDMAIELMQKVVTQGFYLRDDGQMILLHNITEMGMVEV